jgi:hypothetical protein
MHDPGRVGGLYRVADLHDDSRDFFAGKRGIPLRITFQDLAGSPLNGEIV